MVYVDGQIYTVSSPWQNITNFLETECLVNLAIINPSNNGTVRVAYVSVTSEPFFFPLEYYNNQLVLITVGLHGSYIYFLSLSGKG